MKCPRCGYFNLPGAPTCGRCQAALAETAGADKAVPFDELYPPRARNRTAGDRLRAPLRKAAGQLQPRTGRGTRQAVPLAELGNALSVESFRPWLIASAAVVPGVGHLFLRHWGRAGLFLAATALLVLGVVLWIRTPLSDVLLWALLFLAVYSVWDAADQSFPRPSTADGARGFRAVRLFMVSLWIVAGTVLTVSAFLGRSYALWIFPTNQTAPAFLQGDGLLVRRLEHPERQLKRGEVAVYFDSHVLTSIPRTERVVGVPGDRIAGSGSTLWVNGIPVPREHLPLTFRPLAAPIQFVVPPGMICLWRGIGGNAEEAAGATPYLFVGTDRIQGQAIALYQPPARRRWFR